jgi:2,4-dienoyl-CoA reductase-like NADH-dependent reductase (Old Yellow Enzyme family)
MSQIPSPASFATASLFTPLTLPNGAVVPNRLAKAAMEENMATDDALPGQALLALYGAWAKGGAGLILTGNVMVDARAMTGPGGVVLDAAQPLAPFKAWAQAARAGGAQVWMQINHPGRQVYEALGQGAVAPSAVDLDLGKFTKLFAAPRALEAGEIAELVERFAVTAARAEEAGFTGVQIHAAHGYLLSQFLSPLSNRRADAWGGSLENRARLLLDIVRAVRARVSPGFCVSVKLNSADFQKGGFEPADAVAVVGWLNDLAVDVVELSGGSYESPAMQGEAKSSTLAREAYFVDFAREIGATARMPVMVTGGVRRLAVAAGALEAKDGRDGVDLVGIARALAFVPDLADRWRHGATPDVALPAVTWKNRVYASLADMAVTKVQLHRMGAGKPPKAATSPLLALVGGQMETARRTKRYRAWLARR